MEYLQTILTSWLLDYGFDVIEDSKYTVRFFNSKYNAIVELYFNKSIEAVIQNIGANGSVTLQAKDGYDFPEVLTFLDDFFNSVLNLM